MKRKMLVIQHQWKMVIGTDDKLTNDMRRILSVICSPFDFPSDDFPRCHRSQSYFDMRFGIFFYYSFISGLPVFTKVPPPHAAPVQSTTFQDLEGGE